MKYSLLFGLLLLFSPFTPAVNAQPVQLGMLTVQPSSITQDSTRPKNIKSIASVALICAGAIGLFVSSLYFIVRAFKVSPTWGVCMLLFNGLTTLFFCLFQFAEARRPLGIFLLSLAAIVGGFYLDKM